MGNNPGDNFSSQPIRSQYFILPLKSVSITEIIVFMHIWHQSEQLIKWLLEKNSPDENFSKKLGLSVRLTQKKIFFEKNYSNLFCRAFQADHFGILIDGFKTIPAGENSKLQPKYSIL